MPSGFDRTDFPDTFSVMGKIPFFPKNMSVQAHVITALCFVVIWSMVYGHFSQMDGRFFHSSLSGTKGLVLYEIGHYRAAAEAYRSLLQEIYAERETSDPAWDALMRGDLETAESLSRDALEKDPSNIHPLLNLGEIALERGDLDGALRHFDQLLRRESDQFDALLLSAVARAKGGAYPEAIDLLNRALRTPNTEDRITSFLWALKTTGELTELPRWERPLGLIAHLYRYLRIYDSSNERKAISYAKWAIDVGDRPDDAYLTLGVIAFKNRKNEEALASFLKAIETNPYNAEAHRRAAQVYSDRGDLANEYRMTREAYLKAPKDEFYADALSSFLTEKIGDYHQALLLAEHFLRGQPDNVTLLDRAGYLSGMIGNREQALEYFRRGQTLEPDNPRFYEAIGFTLNELGRTEEATEAYQTALSIDPQRPKAYIGLATLYQKEQRYPEAIEAYETAFQLGYDRSKMLTNLCTLYHRMSNFAEAVSCLNAVLSEDPRNALAEHLLSYAMANLPAGRSTE